MTLAKSAGPAQATTFDPAPRAAPTVGGAGSGNNSTFSVTINISTDHPEQYRPVGFQAQVSVQGSLTYVWNFGDNTTSDQVSPSHTYLEFGAQHVVLHVYGANGSSGTAVATVAVAQGVLLSGPSAALNGTVGHPVSFWIVVYGGVAPFSFFWNFGDFNGSHVQNTTHTYGKPGSYYVTLFVNDSAGGQGTFSVFVVIPYPNSTSNQATSPTSSGWYYLAASAGMAVVIVAAAAVLLLRRPPPRRDV